MNSSEETVQLCSKKSPGYIVSPSCHRLRYVRRHPASHLQRQIHLCPSVPKSLYVCLLALWPSDAPKRLKHLKRSQTYFFLRCENATSLRLGNYARRSATSSIWSQRSAVCTIGQCKSCSTKCSRDLWSWARKGSWNECVACGSFQKRCTLKRVWLWWLWAGWASWGELFTSACMCFRSREKRLGNWDRMLVLWHLCLWVCACILFPLELHLLPTALLVLFSCASKCTSVYKCDRYKKKSDAQKLSSEFLHVINASSHLSFKSMILHVKNASSHLSFESFLLQEVWSFNSFILHIVCHWGLQSLSFALFLSRAGPGAKMI